MDAAPGGAASVPCGACKLPPIAASQRQQLGRPGLASGELVGVPPAGSPWRIFRLRSARPDFDPRRAAAELGATGAFFAACPNVRLRPFETFPNDPDLGLQWYAGSSAAKAI